MSFTFGPEWARDTGCCAKPIGCTNTGPACLMRGHPWKRRHAVTPDQPVPFRAGRAGLTQGAVRAVPSIVTGQVVLLADVSEFQPDIADAAYLRWSPAIVVRALYGTRVDRAWYSGARRAALHDGGVRFLGIYAYIRAGQDITAQAKALVSLLGRLRPGEKVIADMEEGTGSQQARWVTWAKVVSAALGDPPWDYSGANYAAAHGLAPVTWVAAYGTREPDPPHKLWQFTDHFSVPGVGTADCSVFHGSIDELAALAYQPAAPKPATTEDDMPSGLITVGRGTRQSVTWRAGAASQIVLYSDWEGVQDAPPVVDLRIAHLDSRPFGAGPRNVNGTDTYTISTPADCNGCSFTRIDSGAASVAFHTNP